MRKLNGRFVTMFSVALLGTVLFSSATIPRAFGDTPAAKYEVLQDRPDRLTAVLPNRLIVIVQEMHTAPVVSAQVWVKTGSVYEQEHVGQGLSHFLEHLLVSSDTPTRTEQQSHDVLGRIGAQINAQTGMDTVHYYINTTGPHAAEAVDLLSDWIQHAKISETRYRRERDVIQREFDMGNGEPSRIMWKYTEQARYLVHPARHPTIGYINEYLTVTRDQITDFYHRMYVPNNMVFVIVGDVDKKKIMEQVATLWAGSEPKKLPTISLPVEPEITAPRSVTGTADMNKPRLRLTWPGTRIAGPGDYQLDLLAVILGRGETSRLVRRVRDEQRLVNSIDAFNESETWADGLFAIDAEIAVGNPTGAKPQAEMNKEAIDHARDAILQVVAHLVEKGVTEEELARAKRTMLADIVYESQSADAIAHRLATDVIEMGDPDYFHRYSEAIQKITAKQINEVAAKFLPPGRLITVTLIPQPRGQKLPPLARPPEEKIAGPLAHETIELDNSGLTGRVTAALKAGEAAAPPVEVGAVQRFVLPNGLRVLVQRDTLVPAVAIQYFQLGGLLADQPGHEGLANAFATMLLKGTTTRSAAQIARQAADLGAELDTQCGNNTLFTKATCLSADWRTVLALVADVNLHPTFPADEWTKVRPRLVAAIARQNDTWSGELHTRFREAYFGNHPWSQAPQGRADVVESLTVEQLADFHRRHLGAADDVLVVIGDVDPEAVRKEAESLFVDLPQKPIEALDLKPAAPPVAKVVQLQTNKPLAAVQIGFGPVGDRKSHDYPAVQVLAKVLGAFPTGWLSQELRGRGPGLVYVVGAGQNTGMIPGYFAVLFNTQPEQVPEAIARSMATIERAKASQVDDATLATAKASVLSEEFLNKQTNSDRATDDALDELYGLGLDEMKNFQHAVDELTPDELQAVAQLYLRNPVAVVLTHDPVPEAVLQKAMEVPATQSAK